MLNRNIAKPSNGSRLFYTIDIITDGSEYTGSGSSFLTIRRVSAYVKKNDINDETNVKIKDRYKNLLFYNSNNTGEERKPTKTSNTQKNEDDIQTSKILARYAFNFSESTSRCCADQKQKMGCIKAMFISSIHPFCTAGIPSLLYAMRNAGSESLHVIGPTGIADYMDHVSELVLGSNKRGKSNYPAILSCECPTPNASTETSWWKVYEDQFIMVHAQVFHDEGYDENSSFIISPTAESTDSCVEQISYTMNNKDQSSIIYEKVKYVITLFNQDCANKNTSDESNSISIAIIPTGAPLHQLPDDVLRTQTSPSQTPLTLILHTAINKSDNQLVMQRHQDNHTCIKSEENLEIDAKEFSIQKSTLNLSKNHFFISCINYVQAHNSLFNVDDHAKRSVTSGILVKAHKWSELFNKLIPCAFPLQAPKQASSESCPLSPQRMYLLSQQNKKHVNFNREQNSTSMQSINMKTHQDCNANIQLLSSSQSIQFRSCHQNEINNEIHITWNKNIQFSSFNSILKAIENYFAILQNKHLLNCISCINQIYKMDPQVSIPYPKNVLNDKKLENINTLDPQFSNDAANFDNDEISIDNLSEEDVKSMNEERYEVEKSDKYPNSIDIDDSSSTEEIVSNTKNADNSTHKKEKNNQKHPGAHPEAHHDLNQGSKQRIHDNEFHILPPIPHLLVLGTGCASPSAIRGSSGYALLLPTTNIHCSTNELSDKSYDHLLAAIIDCGEGCLTALSRHLPFATNNMNKKLKDIKLIWISHAHFDHYGGLPTLVEAIHNAGGRDNECYCNARMHKRQKTSYSKVTTANFGCCSCSFHPVIIAPRKVLKYLDCALESKNGLRRMNKSRLNTGSHPKAIHEKKIKKNEDRLFYGVTHGEFETSPFAQHVRDIIFNFKIPFDFSSGIKSHIIQEQNKTNKTSNQKFTYSPFITLRNVPVEHCACAHALICGIYDFSELLSTEHNSKQFVLCYSGDTRPSVRFVEASKYLGSNGVSLLIHESTFDDDSRGKEEAVKKRHSTVEEAIMIASQMNAKACILTHFSQRYPNGVLSNLHALGQNKYNVKEKTTCKNICVAVDGYLVPLICQSLVSLNLVNECLHDLLVNTS